MDKSKLDECDEKIKSGIIEIKLKPNVSNLYIDIKLLAKDQSSRVVLQGAHTNIILKEKNDEVIL